MQAGHALTIYLRRASGTCAAGSHLPLGVPALDWPLSVAASIGLHVAHTVEALAELCLVLTELSTLEAGGLINLAVLVHAVNAGTDVKTIIGGACCVYDSTAAAWRVAGQAVDAPGGLGGVEAGCAAVCFAQLEIQGAIQHGDLQLGFLSTLQALGLDLRVPAGQAPVASAHC